MNNGIKPDEVATIKDKRWQLDFNLIKLVRNDSSHFIEGPGYIKMEPDGRMVFKLYPNNPLDITQYDKWKSELSVKLIPNEKCYTLTATDAYGRIWEAVNVLPDANFVSEGYIPPVTGNIYGYLKGYSESKYKYAYGQISYICFGKYDAPFNEYTDRYRDVDGKPMKIGFSLDTAKFSIDGLDFCLRNIDEKFIITITSNIPSIPIIVETRAIEALQFLLGRAIDWHIFEKHENGKECIKIRIRRAETGNIYPPLRYRGPGDDHWILYTKYFQYICKNTNNSEWHPISIFIYRILESKKASFETQCLALSVSVEGLLGTEFGDLSKPNEDLLNCIEKVEGILIQSGTPAEIAKRIARVVDGMKTPRPDDQLQELLKNSVITKKEKDTWRKLRNSSTHPKCAFFENLEEPIYKFDTVLTLFYKLIFHRIGYSGKYTDYGTTDMLDAMFSAKLDTKLSEDSEKSI